MSRFRIFLAILGLLLMLPQATLARDGAPETAIVVDYATGDVLHCQRCEEAVPPSSMTKLMTLELLFQRLDDGSLTLDSRLHVSDRAWRRSRRDDDESRMELDRDSDVRVEDLIKGIIVMSGADACLVVAEALAGSEADFARAMNARATELELTQSHFRNSRGMAEEGHYMSAHDLARLAIHMIVAYPEYYEYFGLVRFTWNGDTQENRNALLTMDIGVDGLKTGHTTLGGYGLVASALRNGRRLIVVVNGRYSERERIDDARRLIARGYRELDEQTHSPRGWRGAEQE